MKSTYSEFGKFAGFFDYASATPVDPGVFECMQPFFAEEFYNPSAIYSLADKPKQAIESARTKVAAVLGVRPREIVFTAGCTEANNIAIYGVLSKYPEGKVVISAIEHDSVAGPAGKYDCSVVRVDKNGQLDLGQLDIAIDDSTVLVSIIYASNELGVVQDLRAISKIIARHRLTRKNGLPLYFHTDAAQAANYLPLLCHTLGVDMMSLNGGKMYGPKASGCLYVASHLLLEPIILGGGQEMGLRSGTENVASIVGFAASLELANKNYTAEFVRIDALRTDIISTLEPLSIGVNVSPKVYIPNIVSLYIPGYDNERLVYELDKNGFQVASGSACHARSGENSKVLEAIGIDNQKINSIIRVSMGKHTTKKGVQDLVDCISRIVVKL